MTERCDDVRKGRGVLFNRYSLRDVMTYLPIWSYWTPEEAYVHIEKISKANKVLKLIIQGNSLAHMLRE